MDREHVEKTTKTWGGRWKDPARASGEEKEVQAVSRRKEYCSELQRMMADRSEQRRQDRERDKARERQVWHFCGCLCLPTDEQIVI